MEEDTKGMSTIDNLIQKCEEKAADLEAAGNKQSAEVTKRLANAYQNLRDNAHMNRCPRCGAPESIIEVHGHGQCAVCKSNIADCCQGETCVR